MTRAIDNRSILTKVDVQCCYLHRLFDKLSSTIIRQHLSRVDFRPGNLENLEIS